MRVNNPVPQLPIVGSDGSPHFSFAFAGVEGLPAREGGFAALGAGGVLSILKRTLSLSAALPDVVDLGDIAKIPRDFSVRCVDSRSLRHHHRYC